MKIPILIEETPQQRYRATGGEPFSVSVEANTPETALQEMKKLIDGRVAQGARIEEIELPGGANPWLEGVGIFRDDPLFDDWQEAIADYRRGMNDIADGP